MNAQKAIDSIMEFVDASRGTIFTHFTKELRTMLEQAFAEQKSEHDGELLEEIRDRDRYHEKADDLANAIAKHFRVEIGEHSNANCPWDVALDIMAGGYITDSDEDRLRIVLANVYCPVVLYSDDGELQDNRAHPTIDFKRDTAEEIVEKMKLRTIAAISTNVVQAAEKIVQPQLAVTVSKMSESNGNVTHTVWIHDAAGLFYDGYEAYSSASKGRADYEADRLRRVLDPSLPSVDILAYDTDLPPEPATSEDQWRNLALQFDGHRMQALAWLKHILADQPIGSYPFVRTFMKSPPMSGEAVLAERIAQFAGSVTLDHVTKTKVDMLIERGMKQCGIIMVSSTGQRAMIDMGRVTWDVKQAENTAQCQDCATGRSQ
jgi:hypothetical protein